VFVTCTVGHCCDARGSKRYEVGKFWPSLFRITEMFCSAFMFSPGECGISLADSGSGNEMAAQAESSLRGAARPNGLQVDAHRRKNRDMKNGEQAVVKFFRLLEFERHSAKSQVEHASPPLTLFTNDCVRVCADHRNALGLSLDSIGGG